MRKKFKQSDLHKYFYQDTDPDDILHTHAYRKVGKKNGPSLPSVKRTPKPKDKIVPGYKSSMVGSIAQYQDRTALQPKDSDLNKTGRNGEAERHPKSSARDERDKEDDKNKRRHHFIEPPKRHFKR